MSYFYDNLPHAKGRLTKVFSAVSTTEYTAFDILGRVTAAKQTTDGGDVNGYTTGYTYNLSGALIEETYPSGRKVKNVLDNNGELSLVQSARCGVVNGVTATCSDPQGYFSYAKSFTYNASGAVTSMQLGNGRWESTTFNSRLQPTQIALGTVQNATDKLKLDYTYGTTANNGNVLSQTITVPTVGTNQGFTAVQNYTYDSLNRLKSANETINSTETWKQTFLFDRYGNRRFDEANTTMPSSFANEAVTNPTISTSNNRLTSPGYAYDASGNTTADAGGQSYTYDAENKMISASNSSGTIGEYFYDGDGKRMKKIVPSTGEVTVFVYDAAGKLIGEYSTVVTSPQESKVSYLTNDHLGSPRINTDATGGVIARHDYMPYGEEIFTAQRTTGLNYSADSVRKQFTGYERDDETSLDFAQARYYNKNHGRFTTTDPLFFQDDRLIIPQRFNLFVYAANSPTKYTDPSGLDVEIKGEGSSDRVEDINSRDGGAFKVKLGASNLLEIIDKDKIDYQKLSDREKALFDAITDTDTRATLKGVKSDGRFDFGAFSTQVGETVGTNLLDNGDLSLLRKKSKVAAGEIVAHEIIEAFSSAGDKNAKTKGDYQTHHAVANKLFSGIGIKDGNVKFNSAPNQGKLNPLDRQVTSFEQPLKLKTPTQSIKWTQTVVISGGPFKASEVIKTFIQTGSAKGNITKIQ